MWTEISGTQKTPPLEGPFNFIQIEKCLIFLVVKVFVFFVSSIDINTANIKEHERVMIFIFFLFHILLSLSFIVF